MYDIELCMHDISHTFHIHVYITGDSKERAAGLAQQKPSPRLISAGTIFFCFFVDIQLLYIEVYDMYV
jgi:hypothetical protein